MSTLPQRFRARRSDILGIFRRKVEEIGKVATGDLQRSFRMNVKKRGDFGVEIEIRAKDFQVALEGRGPGRPPPLSEIRRYLRAKGSTANPFVLQRRIGLRGTNPQSKYPVSRFFAEIRPELEQIVQETVNQDDSFRQEILNRIRESLRGLTN